MIKRTKPNLIDAAKTIELIEFIEGSTYVAFKEAFHKLDKQGWQFFPVNQTRGRCYYGKKLITIPSWAFKRGSEYLVYYISHEMAHAINPVMDHHGPSFMSTFRSICPPHLQYHELDYKPQNASAAGISAPKEVKLAKMQPTFSLPNGEEF